MILATILTCVWFATLTFIFVRDQCCFEVERIAKRICPSGPVTSDAWIALHDHCMKWGRYGAAFWDIDETGWPGGTDEPL